MRIAVVLMLASSVLVPFGGSAHRRTEEGNRQYTEGNYPEALRSYTEAQVKSPEAAELFYDLGNVFFRQDDFERASEAYTRALLMASGEFEGAVAYNLGNAKFRLQEYPEAVKAYERALGADPSDLDAKRNLELALRAQQQQQHQPQQVVLI